MARIIEEGIRSPLIITTEEEGIIQGEIIERIIVVAITAVGKDIWLEIVLIDLTNKVEIIIITG
jgi:hypothetical protein